MVRFKQFSGQGPGLERDINLWLGEYEPDISQMVQTVGQDGTITIGVLFEESFRGQEIRMSVESGMRDATGRPVPESALEDRPISVPQEPGQYTQDSSVG